MNIDPVNPRHGGTGQGAGREAAHGESTKTVRVPQSFVPLVIGYLNELKRSPALKQITALRTVTPIPTLGRQVRVGKPTSGDDNREKAIDLSRQLASYMSSTCVMKEAGWSMRDAGIADVDELVVDTGLFANDGRVVVAGINGELTVKRLKCTDTGWFLQASNADFADIPIGNKNELHTCGGVTRVLHAV
jgi:DNA polymerase V